MQAKRIECGVSELWHRREPGTYTVGKVSGHDESIVLFLVLPNGAIGSVKNAGDEPTWTITEHDDGTHTVSPSIHANPRSVKPDEPEWHGFLERGVFREC